MIPTSTYTHDLRNRLVNVAYRGDVRAMYTYNGLNWRISTQADTDAFGGGGTGHRPAAFYGKLFGTAE